MTESVFIKAVYERDNETGDVKYDLLEFIQWAQRITPVPELVPIMTTDGVITRYEQTVKHLPETLALCKDKSGQVVYVYPDTIIFEG